MPRDPAAPADITAPADPVAPADLAELRADAENPLLPPSRRVAARMALKALGEGPKRRGPIEAEDGAMILRVLVRAAGDT